MDEAAERNRKMEEEQRLSRLTVARFGSTQWCGCFEANPRLNY
jgi:hypothetical protein